MPPAATVQDILKAAVELGASDIHLVPALPPMFRVHTVLSPAMEYPPVTTDGNERFVMEQVGKHRFQAFQERRDIDFSCGVEGVSRFRVNAHYQRMQVAISFRVISASVPALADLNLPPVVEAMTNMPRGLVLVTGPTGSGKSTTLASMIMEMNRKFQHHIITLEDPIEYELTTGQCVIEQREVGIDVPNFASGLRHALRQDPDVILVGEMRDLETTGAAISAAETGHLVLSTLHTSSAAQTIERIIDIYPGEQQNQIRSMLANTLKAVISMTLFRRQDMPGMIPACEIMVATSAVRACIRENRIHEIPNMIVTGRHAGMCTMEDAIRELEMSGRITEEDATNKASRADQITEIVDLTEMHEAAFI